MTSTASKRCKYKGFLKNQDFPLTKLKGFFMCFVHVKYKKLKKIHIISDVYFQLKTYLCFFRGFRAYSPNR